MSISARRPGLVALFLAALVFAAPIAIVPLGLDRAEASPGNSYSGPYFGAGNLPTGCISDMSRPAPENFCYHMRTGLNSLDSPKVDVLVMVPVSPTAERDMRIMRQSIEMWEEGIDYLAGEMGLDWLEQGMDFHITVDFFDPLGGEGGEFTTYPIVDPEIVVIATNPVGGIGIGIDPLSVFPFSSGGVPCHTAENPFDFQYWESLPGFNSHHEERSGTYVEDCEGKGGNICFAINGAVDPDPSRLDIFSLFDLVSHEFGHCLTVGHVGDGAEGSWGAVPRNDIMAYDNDPANRTKCVSTLDVEGVALRMSRYLDVNGDGAVNDGDPLVPNDPIGTGDPLGEGSNPFQVQHPDDHLYASNSGDPYDCPQPDVGLVPGPRTDWTPEAGADDWDGDGVSDAIDNCASIANPAQEDADGNGRGDACERSPRTLYMDGGAPAGELNQAPRLLLDGDYLQLNTAPGSAEKSMMIPNRVGNTNCAGNTLFPVFIGHVDGRVVGDMKVAFPAVANGESVEIRVWPDVRSLRCNADYPQPAGKVVTALPAREKRTVEATIPNLDFVADSRIMIQITPVLAPGPAYARAFYGTPVSKVTFDFIPDTDFDDDGIEDAQDNCPRDANAGQEDADGDGRGDACERTEPDGDGDGIPNAGDNCPGVANQDQEDSDGDGVGDACEQSTAGPPCADVSDDDAFLEDVNFFHRSGAPGSDVNQVDVVASQPTFNEQAPSADRPAVSVDPALVGTTGPNGPYDALWSGSISDSAGSIRCLTLDLWQKNPIGEGLFGTADYGVTVWVGPQAKMYELGVVSAPGSDQAISHVRGALTTMLDPTGKPVDLDIPVAAGEQVTIGLQDWWLGGHAAILYDSRDYASGMTINEGLLPEAVGTNVAFTSQVTEGQHSDDVTIGATLTDEAGAALANQVLGFTAVGISETLSWTAETDDSGLASVVKRLDITPGRYQVMVEYRGEADTYEGSSDLGGFLVVSKEDTATVLEVASPTGKGKKASRTLTATVSDPDGSSLVAGRTVSFYSDGEFMGTVVTSDQGVAEYKTPHNFAYGHRFYEARFAGDDFYIGSWMSTPS